MQTMTANANATSQGIPPRDRQENFHGNQLLYVLWERHLVICSPIALALPPNTTFNELIEKVLPDTVFAQHPDWVNVDWNTIEWRVSGKSFKPDLAKTLDENGLTHKTLLRMKTPGLNGIGGVFG